MNAFLEEKDGTVTEEEIEGEEEIEIEEEIESEEEIEEDDEAKKDENEEIIDRLANGEKNSNESGFKKIHQFEICLKRQNSDVNNTSIRSRLSFEIRLLFPNKNEARFEVNIGQSKESSIPKFEFRDEILVTNIY